MRESKSYPKEIQKYLRPGVKINSDYNNIKSKSIEIIGSINEPIEKVKILYEFVRDQIDEEACENLKASEVLSAGHGMCYEKANLLAALCRSARIPARISFDKVYIKNYKDIRKDNELRDIEFLHGITEIYLNGKWIKYDPTGNVKRWKKWIQDDNVNIQLPIQFNSNKDVVFPSDGRIITERTNYYFFDWTEEVTKLVDDFNTT